MRFRCGSHNLAVATVGRWYRCPLGQRICQNCTADEVEMEHHVISDVLHMKALRH
jgi:hypothetical protein